MRTILIALGMLCGLLQGATPTVIPLIAEAKTEPASGAPAYSEIYLAKRTLDPTAGEIRVSIVQLDPSGGAREHVTRMKVSGDKYTMEDAATGYTGEGKLFGEAWNWSRWTYKIVWKNQAGSMSGEDERTAEGGLSMRKKYFTAAGELSRSVTALFHPLTESAHALLFSKLLGR